jgi:hypothetical protein
MQEGGFSEQVHHGIVDQSRAQRCRQYHRMDLSRSVCDWLQAQR